MMQNAECVKWPTQIIFEIDHKTMLLLMMLSYDAEAGNDGMLIVMMM